MFRRTNRLPWRFRFYLRGLKRVMRYSGKTFVTAYDGIVAIGSFGEEYFPNIWSILAPGGTAIIAYPDDGTFDLPTLGNALVRHGFKSQSAFKTKIKGKRHLVHVVTR